MRDEPEKSCQEVPREVCEDVAREACEEVPTETCRYVPRDECSTVTRHKCKDVYNKVPKQHCMDESETNLEGGETFGIIDEHEQSSIVGDELTKENTEGIVDTNEDLFFE